MGTCISLCGLTATRSLLHAWTQFNSPVDDDASRVIGVWSWEIGIDISVSDATTVVGHDGQGQSRSNEGLWSVWPWMMMKAWVEWLIYARSFRWACIPKSLGSLQKLSSIGVYAMVL